MTPFPEENSPAHSRMTPWRVGALVFCVVAALAAALAWKHWNRPEAKAPPISPVAATISASATPPPAERTPEQILAAIPTPTGASATDKVLKTTLDAARQKPMEAVAWVNLGDTLSQEERDTGDARYYDLAEMAYHHALTVNPKSVDAMAGMAWVTGGRHTFDLSVDWAKRALALDPTNAAAEGIIGDAALELGKYEEAYDAYQKMMDLKPDLSSWSRGAYLLWITGNSSKAQWLMERAINAGAPFAENTAWCRAKSALMLFNDGAYVPAAQMLKPALAAGTRNAHVLLAAGQVTAALGDYPAAAGHYQRLLEGGPNHDALVGLGDLAAAQGNKEEAEKFYAQVEALHAAHLATGVHDHLAMAKFYADHDRSLVEALRMAEQVKLTENVLQADIVAWVYFKNGDQAHAIEAIKRALSQHTKSAELEYHAGMIAATAGDESSAKKHLGAALNDSPRFDLLQASKAVEALAKLGSETPAGNPATEPAAATVKAGETGQ